MVVRVHRCAKTLSAPVISYLSPSITDQRLSQKPRPHEWPPFYFRASFRLPSNKSKFKSKSNLYTSYMRGLLRLPIRAAKVRISKLQTKVRTIHTLLDQWRCNFKLLLFISIHFNLFLQSTSSKPKLQLLSPSLSVSKSYFFSTFFS